MDDVYFYEVFKEECELLKRHLPSSIKAGLTAATIQESGDKKPPAKIISLRTQSIILDDWALSVDGILSRTTGFDHLFHHKKKTDCGYLPMYCHRAVAEQAMLLWMNLLRKFPLQLKQFNNFERNNLTGHEARGKTVAIIGVGRIGYEIYQIAQGLQMNPIAVDIVQHYSEIHYEPLEEALAKAAIIVCAMDLSPTNKGFFSYELLKKSKRGGFFVNVSRGELSPAIGLLKLMEEGHLEGIALDVFNEEWQLGKALRDGEQNLSEELKALTVLQKMERVILTPHNSFNTKEAVERKAQQTVQQVEHFLMHGEFIWPVPV